MPTSFICFDLDGTLVDIKTRYYSAHKQACNDEKLESLPQDEYWEKKRNKIPETEIIKASPEKVKQYNEKRIAYLENKTFLAMDTLFPKVIDLLQRLKTEGNILCIASMRRNAETANWQIDQLGIRKYFADILFKNPENDPISEKAKVIHTKQDLYKKCKKQYMCGDTEADILCGKKLGFTTIAVPSGIRTKKILADLSPDLLFTNVSTIDIF